MLRNAQAEARTRRDIPTALLPTIATFLCFGAAGILLLAFWGGRVEAERLASVEKLRLQSTAGRSCLAFGSRYELAFLG